MKSPIAVFKQERYEAHQEALALTQGQKPTQVVERDGRQVEIWDVRSVRLADAIFQRIENKHR